VSASQSHTPSNGETAIGLGLNEGLHEGGQLKEADAEEEEEEL
jgi:hypothetical protein